jgi:hypothetical protein
LDLRSLSFISGMKDFPIGKEKGERKDERSLVRSARLRRGRRARIKRQRGP